MVSGWKPDNTLGRARNSVEVEPTSQICGHQGTSWDPPRASSVHVYMDLVNRETNPGCTMATTNSNTTRDFNEVSYGGCTRNHETRYLFERPAACAAPNEIGVSTGQRNVTDYGAHNITLFLSSLLIWVHQPSRVWIDAGTGSR